MCSLHLQHLVFRLANILGDASATVEVTPVTFEADARGVAKCLGEVVAGIVYATDAASASNVDGVVIPEAEAVNVEYVGNLTGCREQEVLIEFLKSDAGRSALADRGFLLHQSPTAPRCCVPVPLLFSDGSCRFLPCRSWLSS